MPTTPDTDADLRAAITTAVHFAQGQPGAPQSLLHRLVLAAYAGKIPNEPADRSVLQGNAEVWARDDSKRNHEWYDLETRDQDWARIATWVNAGSARRHSWPEAWFLDNPAELLATAKSTGPGRDADDAEWEAWHRGQTDERMYTLTICQPPAAGVHTDPGVVAVNRDGLEIALEEAGVPLAMFSGREEGEADIGGLTYHWQPADA